MFVNSIDINEFRGIKKCQLPIKFSNFTVLIGRNNSGKSTILEALSLLPHPDIYDVLFNDNKKEVLKSLHPEAYNRLLYLYAGDSILEYRVVNKPFKIELSEGTFKMYARETSLEKNDIANLIGTETRFLNGYVIFFPDIANLLNTLELQLKIHKELLMKKQIHIDLANVLNQLVNDQYSEIVFLEPISLRKIYPNQKIAYLRLSELGSGAEKVIKMMASLEIYSPQLVIIDDFEAGLHPSLIKFFLQWLKEKNWQKVISTHSIDVLYYLVDINPPDTTILQLNKSNEDILSHKVLKLEELEDLLDANTDPRLLLDNLGL